MMVIYKNYVYIICGSLLVLSGFKSWTSKSYARATLLKVLIGPINDTLHLDWSNGVRDSITKQQFRRLPKKEACLSLGRHAFWDTSPSRGILCKEISHVGQSTRRVVLVSSGCPVLALIAQQGDVSKQTRVCYERKISWWLWLQGFNISGLMQEASNERAKVCLPWELMHLSWYDIIWNFVLSHGANFVEWCGNISTALVFA